LAAKTPVPPILSTLLAAREDTINGSGVSYDAPRIVYVCLGLSRECREHRPECQSSNYRPSHVRLLLLFSSSWLQIAPVSHKDRCSPALAAAVWQCRTTLAAGTTIAQSPCGLIWLCKVASVRLGATATNPNSRRSRFSCARARRLRTGTPEAEPAILCIAAGKREALISVPRRCSVENVSLGCNHHSSKRRESRHGHHKLTHCCLPFSFLALQRPRVAVASLRGALASAVYSPVRRRSLTHEVCWSDLRDSGDSADNLSSCCF
jgi:hypothetical protein